MEVNQAVFIIILMLIFSAFFSGIEIAFYSANKLRLELKRKQGELSAKLMSFFVRKPSHFMSNTLVGNNLALVIYSIYMKFLIDFLFLKTGADWLQIGIVNFIAVTFISSLIVLIFAEFLPKALFRINPDKMLSFLAVPFNCFYYLFYPINIVILSISHFILRNVLKVQVKENAPVFNHFDLFHFVAESTDEDENDIDLDTQIFKNAIEFPNVKVRECMIPRTEVKSFEISSPFDDLKNLFTETGHSKLIIYRENIDNIVGYVHIIDLFKNPEKIEDILMPITITTESMPASEALRLLIEKHRSIAVVVDEFGGTSGIITIEDIIEEIFGEIRDEHDVDELKEKKISDHEFLFSARLEIDYLNETYNLNLPSGDYETLGGLILHINESIPDPKEVIEHDPYKFTIVDVSGARINTVKVEVKYNAK